MIATEILVDVLPMEMAHARLVVDALVANAVKHGGAAEDGALLRMVEIQDRIETSVRDEGPGIPPKYCQEVFEPLRLLQSRDEREGAGMGLAHVARIADLYGGDAVLMLNSDGPGLTVRFSCPP